MCGRCRLSRRKQIIEEQFDNADWQDDWSPRYNIAPTQPVPVIRQHTKEPVRRGIMPRFWQSALENFMARDIIRTPNAPSPPPTYSQAVRAAGLVFVSGTSPHDPATGKIIGDTIQEQTRQCLENVSAILKAAGTSLERVVSATVILLEETDFAGMNEEWIKWFPSNPPARQGAKLPVRIPGMRVSIAAIAEA
jgi:2-iminobutanoate/2-iminopropanoate deaminase